MTAKVTGQPLVVRATWDPAKHPRGPGGQFIGVRSAELTVGKGGKYIGAKVGAELPIGKSGRRGTVLVKGIVGYAPPSATKPRKKSGKKSAAKPQASRSRSAGRKVRR